jgi:hypothetical protein
LRGGRFHAFNQRTKPSTTQNLPRNFSDWFDVRTPRR